MSADELIIDLEDRGGSHRFRSAEDVIAFIDREFKAWAWMAEHADRFGLWNQVNARLVWLRDNVQQAVNQGQPLANQAHLFQQAFDRSSEAALHSESELGRRIRDIFESEGAPAAFAAYAFALRRINLGQLSQIDEVTGAVLLSVPAMIRPEAVQRRLAQERRNLAARAERLLQKLDDEAAARHEDHEAKRMRARRVAFAVGRHRFARWSTRFDSGEASAKKITEEFSAHHAETKSEFETLQAAFLETMRLKAPASYWNTKAAQHKKAEFWGIARLFAFFPIAVGGLGFVFWCVGQELLQVTATDNSTALYVIASAGLATLAGVVFWIGRLLTKLYLSEHHLRIDAEEREIMTTTYLALTKDAAATDADRTIILTALFRSTPDGIVKDDGSMDVSLAALLSKVGMPGR